MSKFRGGTWERHGDGSVSWVPADEAEAREDERTADRCTRCGQPVNALIHTRLVRWDGDHDFRGEGSR